MAPPTSLVFTWHRFRTPWKIPSWTQRLCWFRSPAPFCSSMLIKLYLFFGRKHLTTLLALVPKSQLAHLKLELGVAPPWGAAIYLHHLLIITLWIMHIWRWQALCVRCMIFLHLIFCNIERLMTPTLPFTTRLILGVFVSRCLKAILNSRSNKTIWSSLWKGTLCLAPTFCQDCARLDTFSLQPGLKCLLS